MEPVVAWALGIASCIFALGMTSAIASRWQRNFRCRAEIKVARQRVAQDLEMNADLGQGEANNQAVYNAQGINPPLKAQELVAAGRK